ncbi:hypothetical protein B7C62_30635 [Kitasatospora albolonga]|uniref:Uncharacterized protein n=1 Tax=Kitasatospora albolonga TaxID=68173 RepID=A0ABC8C169_9ACTN|nr:hypothetical protein B7C62_30635 [Kitasatospora albolonga]
MLFSSVGSVVAISVPTSLTACFIVACATACYIAKRALADTSSADRPKILKQYVMVLRTLFTFPLRRK